MTNYVLHELCKWENVADTMFSQELSELKDMETNEKTIPHFVSRMCVLALEELRAEVSSQLLLATDASTAIFDVDRSRNYEYIYDRTLVTLYGRLRKRHEGPGEIRLSSGQIGNILLSEGSRLVMCRINPTEWRFTTPALNWTGFDVAITMSAKLFNSLELFKQDAFHVEVLQSWITSFKRVFPALNKLRSSPAAKKMLEGRSAPASATPGTDPAAVAPATVPTISEWWYAEVFERLDASQKRAVLDAVRERLSVQNRTGAVGSHCTWGPPGTGKSYTLLAMILAFAAVGDVVYVTAYTNVAVAQIAARLLLYLNDPNSGLEMCECVLVGRPERILAVDGVQVLHLDWRVDTLRRLWDLVLQDNSYPDYDSDAEARAWVTLEMLIPRSKRGYLQSVRQRGISDARWDRAELEKIFVDDDTLSAAILNEAKVVLSTVSVAGRDQMQNVLRRTKVVVCDEAAQVPSAMFTILLTGSAEFFEQAGDHRQLAATVKSKRAAELGYGRSVFEDLVRDDSNQCRLSVQRRSDEAIVEYFSGRYYQGGLTTDFGPYQTQRNAQVRRLLPPVTIFSFSSEEELEGTSYKNRKQANAAVVILMALHSAARAFRNNPLEVVVLTLYSAQVPLLEQKISEKKFDKRWVHVQVKTVDNYQGREADVIVLTTIRSNAARDIGHSSDERRFLVSVSRARYAMCLVTDAGTFERCEVWRKYYEFYLAMNSCRVFRIEGTRDLNVLSAQVTAANGHSALLGDLVLAVNEIVAKEQHLKGFQRGVGT